MRDAVIERYKNGMTKHPADLSTESLVETYKLYSGLQSRGITDEVYLSLLESEIDHRKQYPFNAAELAKLGV